MKTMLTLLCLGTALWAQVAEKANSGYKTETGRAAVARTLTAADRAESLQAEAFVKSLGLKPGQSAADIGTGAGVLLPLLSKAVGAQGKVYAEDIFPDFLETARKKAEAEKLTNITWVRGTEKTPNLPEGCCDVAVAVDAYHHFDYPAEMVAGIRAGLKPGGRFVILDYYRRMDAMGPGPRALEHIRADIDEVIKEVEAAGLKLVERREHVAGKQYVAVFEKK